VILRGSALALTALLVHGTVVPSASPPRATWVWEDDPFRLLDDAAFRAETIRSLKNRRIGTVYLYADAFQGRNPLVHEPDRYRRLIAAFHERGIAVQALLGSIDLHTERYILPELRTAAERMFREVLDYNRRAEPTERFDGVNLDIEPYILDDWRPRREERAGQYLDLCARYRRMRDEAGAPLAVGPAMPFWFDGIAVSWSVETAPLSEHVQRIFDYVAIMDYRDHALGRDGIVSHAQDEIAFADRIGRKVVIGVETLRTTPPKVTFYEEGSNALERELTLTTEAFRDRPSFAGFAIHHWETYRAMPAGPRVTAR